MSESARERGEQESMNISLFTTISMGLWSSTLYGVAFLKSCFGNGGETTLDRVRASFPRADAK